MPMECPECDGTTTRVLETRTEDSGIVRRRYACDDCQHRFNTVELPAKALNCPTMRGSIRRYEKLLEQAARSKIKAEDRAEMVRLRRQGKTTAEIAEMVGRSIHMVRYYTRMPREKLYPGVAMRKKKEQQLPPASSAPS